MQTAAEIDQFIDFIKSNIIIIIIIFINNYYITLDFMSMMFSKGIIKKHCKHKRLHIIISEFLTFPIFNHREGVMS